jgi:methanogenic corrinoid protein MtbC1
VLIFQSVKGDFVRPIISPRELAEAIDVSESSLKRWADEGLIEVSRTAGGHRRIAIGEAIRFIRAIRAPLVRPDVLGLSDLSPGGEQISSPQSPEDRLFRHLREGHAREARGLIVALYLSGRSVADIADGPIQSAMSLLGELWKHDPAGIYVEHLALDICIQGVQQLRQLVQPQDLGLLALGGAPSGDPYLLPSLLAATALAAEGWRTINLGPDTPIESYVLAAERHRPKLVWLSISSASDASATERGVADLATSLARYGIELVVGGRALESLSLPSSHVHRGNSFAELIAVAHAIQKTQSSVTPSAHVK